MDIETKIAERLVDDILAAGYTITINDGEEDTVIRSSNKAEIIGALRTVEWDYINVMRRGGRVGTICLIWGNGIDLVSDYSWRGEGGEKIMTDLTAGANRVADGEE